MTEADPTNSLPLNPPPQDEFEKSLKNEEKYDQEEKVCKPLPERQDSKALIFDCTSEESTSRTTSSQKESSCHERKKKIFPISTLREEFTKARFNIPSSMKELIVSNREKQSVRQKYYGQPQANSAPHQDKLMAKYKYPKKRDTLTFGLMTAHDEKVKTD